MTKVSFFKEAIIMAIVPLLTLSSCTMNEDGDVEVSGIFWVFLAIIVIAFIIGMCSDKKEANRRGMSLNQLYEEKNKQNERKMMSSGFEVEYLGGYPKWNTPCKVNFSIRNSNIVLTKGSEKMEITKDMIVAISNEKSGHRSVGKTAAGAIVGGVLTGGIGLIVGGALGARKKDTSEVFITYRYNSIELTLNLRPGKNTDKVYALINSVFS